jgi:formylglycine-generating enzyme required for sulfatase activity
VRPFLRHLLAAITLTFSAFVAATPTVSNVTFSQQYDEASQGTVGVITYDLATPGGATTITAYASRASVANSEVLLSPADGDVGPGLTTGTGYRIVWSGLRTQFPDVLAADFQFSISANDGTLVPLNIQPSVSWPSLAQTANQTFTITFSEPVNGFEASDVVVTGGTTTSFVQISPVEFALGVSGEGGLISAMIPENAAFAISDNVGVSSATATLFYQDRKTIGLPGGMDLDLVRIPAGTFIAGAAMSDPFRQADEQLTTVTLTRDWYMGVTEITQGQWLSVMGAWPGLPPAPGPDGGAGLGTNLPAYNVSWNDTQAFLSALNDHLTSSGQGLEVRLPTEAEWERAAKAGLNAQFSFGDVELDVLTPGCVSSPIADDSMWYCATQSGHPVGTKMVGQKSPNAYGLFDMHGNVYEWCQDWYASYSSAGEATDPAGPVSGDFRVIRGGSWYNTAGFCRSSHRNSLISPVATDGLGFRLAASLE